MPTPEEQARENTDDSLRAAGWVTQDYDDIDLGAASGIAVREYPLATGTADYLLFVDRKAIGAIEVKAEGTPLSGVEARSEKCSAGLPSNLKAWRNPPAFL